MRLAPFLAGMVLGMSAVALAQNGSKVLKQGTTIQWDRVTTDVDGNPESVSHYDLAITVRTQPPSTAIRTVQVPDVPAPQYDALTLFQGLNPGNYDVYVRAVDVAGNASEWSLPLFVVFDQVMPSKVANLRIVQP